MATSILDVGTAGRTYATWTLAEAQIASEAGNDVIIEPYDDSPYDENVVFNDDTALSITVLPVASERHDGSPGSGVRFVQSGDLTSSIVFGAESLEASWFEIDGNGSAGRNGATAGVIQVNNETVAPKLSHALIHDFVTASYNIGIYVGDANSEVSRFIIFDMENTHATNRYSLGFWGVGPAEVTNCVAHRIRCSNAGNTEVHIGYQTVDARNCIAGAITSAGSGTVEDYRTGFIGAGSEYCISEDLTAPGTGSITGEDPADIFVSVTDGFEDYTLKTGSAAFEAGFDYTTTYFNANIDMTGRDVDAQGDTWSIGAFQLEQVLDDGGPSGRLGRGAHARLPLAMLRRVP